MINSMTAFSHREICSDWGNAAWELRSLNHRYLEINLYLPDPLAYLEPIIRKHIQTYLRRGKIDVKLYYKLSTNKASPIGIDKVLAKSLIKTYSIIADLAKTSIHLNPIDLLRWPQLLKLPSINYLILQPDLEDLFLKALCDLCSIRKNEGEIILTLINQRLTQVDSLIRDIKKQLPHLVNQQQKKLLSRLAETKINVDPNRLEQEVLLLSQKMDVAEELDRLQFHLHRFREILLQKNQAKGKQLDFLLQELNREANTLASKSLSADLTLAAVNIKVLVEEIREQVQNIE